jgi:hypothetical protein
VRTLRPARTQGNAFATRHGFSFLCIPAVRQ